MNIERGDLTLLTSLIDDMSFRSMLSAIYISFGLLNLYRIPSPTGSVVNNYAI